VMKNIIIMLAIIVMVFPTLPSQVIPENAEIKKFWKEGDVEIMYWVEHNKMLSKFNVWYKQKLICNFRADMSGNRSGSLMFEPDAGIRATVSFAEIGKDEIAQLTGIILEARDGVGPLDIKLIWDFEKSEFTKIVPEPSPF